MKIDCPDISGDELENIDLPGMIDLMIRVEDRVPRNVIDECARRGDTMVEQLSGLVDAAMQDNAGWERFNDPWKFYLPSEIVARQQRWAEEDAENDADVGDGDYGYDEMFLPETYVRAEPKIGRNDPCPCGSGKKYKKCCLGQDEAGGGEFF